MTRQEKWIEAAAWAGAIAMLGGLAYAINYALGQPDDNIQAPKTSRSFIVETPQGETYECWMFENTVQCDYPGEADE
jgi:hypothetical protein